MEDTPGAPLITPFTACAGGVAVCWYSVNVISPSLTKDTKTGPGCAPNGFKLTTASGAAAASPLSNGCSGVPICRI